MNQVIQFRRGSTTYTSYEAAITALNGVTHKAGQPVIVYYTESEEDTDVKILLAIGIDEGTGSDKYNVIGSDVQADWDEESTTSPAYILNKPTIPTVNDATFTIKSKIGDTTTSIADFTANQASNDDFTLVQGNNITLSNDTTNRTITVNATDSSFYGTSSTAATTSSKTSTINGYVLKTGGLVSIKFTEQVNASATLNINNGTSDTGAKDIYYNGAAITDGIIKAGDVATFIYDGTYYQLVSINTASVGTVFGGSGTNHKSGAVPDPGSSAGTTKFLREDGSWQVPSYTAPANDGEISFNMKVGETTTEVSDFTADQENNDSFTLEQGSNISLTSESTGTIKIAATNSASLQVSDTSNKKINTSETTGKYIQFTGGTNKFTVSDGTSSFDVDVTPNITDNVTGSSLTSDKIILGNGNSSVKASSVEITTTAPTSSSDDTTIPTSKAVWDAIDNGIALSDAMIYKGTIDGGNSGSYGALTGAADRGWTYKVTTAGRIDGVVVEIGDIIICNTDDTDAATESNYTTIAANWDFIQANIDGVVIGPASSTSSHVATFNGTTGKVIKDSGYTIEKSVPSDAVFTDTSVTSSANHYTPETLTTTGDIVGTLSGSAGEYVIDTEYTVLTGITSTTDGKGHITGITYTAQKVKDTNTTYTSQSASEGGTDVSLVTTGEKYTWNHIADGKADKIVTETFSDSKAYSVGDYVTYNSKLYKCTAEHSAGAWDDRDFTESTGNFAMYDKEGNILDSGKNASDFATAAQGSLADSAIQSVKTINSESLAGTGDIVLPAEITANPEFLSNDQCNSLKAGDIVIKDDLTGKHPYIVTFKSSTSMCLTYADAENVETIAWDKDGNTWSKTDKTVTPIGEAADVSNKADKVTSAVSGNFAGLDSNGNLTDSGKKATDFETAGTATDLISELDAVVANYTVGTGGSADSDVQADGLKVKITEVDGKITNVTANIVSGTYDPAGAASAVLGTSSDTSSDNTVYGAKAYADSLLVGGVKYKGIVDATASTPILLPTTDYKQGDLYIVAGAGTYAGKVCEVGDWLLANKNYVSGATAANDWNAVTGENQVDNKNASLTIGSAVTIATVDGTDITVTQVEDLTKIEAVNVSDTTEYDDITSLFTTP